MLNLLPASNFRKSATLGSLAPEFLPSGLPTILSVFDVASQPPGARPGDINDYAAATYAGSVGSLAADLWCGD